MNQSFTTYIGIDPGVTGAIALDCGNSAVIFDTPNEKRKVGREWRNRIVEPELLALARALVVPGSTFVGIEKVGGMRGQGAGPAFAFGETVGLLRMAFLSAGATVEGVHAISWKNHFRLSNDKDRSRALASELCPSAVAEFSRKKDADRAEAFLIARYFREIHSRR